MKFEGVLFAVRDMAVSRNFYETVMGRKVAMDLGANLVFEGGPTLQERFFELAGFPEEQTVYRAHNTELYFETNSTRSGSTPGASGSSASTTPTATSSS